MMNSVTYHAFLSYRSDDRPTVIQIADELKRRGCRCFLDQWYLVPGQDWVVALEKALASSQSVVMFVGPGEEMGRWQQRERAWALDRQAGDPRFSVIPVLLTDCKPPLGFLGQLMWIDLRANPTDPEQLDRLAAVIRGAPTAEPVQRQPRATVCPYRGMLYFREEDASFFFGRNTYIEQLVSKVGQHALVAVVGASGSGKSSLVRAGLLPRLRAPDRQKVWEIVAIVPDSNPLFSLARALLPLIEPELTGYELISKSARAADDLKNERVLLGNLVDAALQQQKGANRLLLIVDQWEELYTQCEDSTERAQFIQQILAVTDRERSLLTVVLTVRADFYHQLLQDRALLDHLQDGKLDLGPMTPEELREAIEEPAKAVGITFQDGLVDRLLGDAGEEPGRLPLLEFALEELWKRHDSGKMTHRAYDALGRLSGAIAEHAERVYAELDERERQVAPSLFRRLVRAGSKTEEDTRRRADLKSLDEVSQRIVRRLADGRLLVTTRIAASGEISNYKAVQSVEVAHEELLRRWSRLSKWIDADRKFLQWRCRLAPSLEQYQRDPTSALLRYGALREAKQFYPERKSELEDDEKDFLAASRQADMRKKVSVFSLVLMIIGMLWGFNTYNSARKAVERVVYGSAELFESHFNELQRYQRLLPPLVNHWFQTKWEEAVSRHSEESSSILGPRQRRHILYALARFGNLNDGQFEALLAEANSVPREDRANYVRALQSLTSMDVDWHAETRAAKSPTAGHLLASTALSLGNLGPAEWMARLAPNPANRTELIHNLLTDTSPGLNHVLFVLRHSDDDALLSAVCCALGRNASDLSDAQKREVVTVLQELHQHGKGGGVHSASGWALRKLGERPVVPMAAGAAEHIAECWRVLRVNSFELTFVLIPPDNGSDEPARVGDEPSDESIGTDFSMFSRDRSTSEFWISDREVSRGLFEMYRDDASFPGLRPEGWILTDDGERSSPSVDHPVCEVSWHEAAAFCNWLSWKAGFAENRWYYEIAGGEEGLVASGSQHRSERDGYRLPTASEWLHACRSGSMADYCFGDDVGKLAEYGVYGRDYDTGSTEPGGEKMPNGWGLFDMHGNVWEWCDDGDASLQVFRGGSWGHTAGVTRSAYHVRSYSPSYRYLNLGFRLALSPLGPVSGASGQASGAGSGGSEGSSGAELGGAEADGNVPVDSGGTR